MVSQEPNEVNGSIQGIVDYGDECGFPILRAMGNIGEFEAEHCSDQIYVRKSPLDWKLNTIMAGIDSFKESLQWLERVLWINSNKFKVKIKIPKYPFELMNALPGYKWENLVQSINQNRHECSQFRILL